MLIPVQLLQFVWISFLKYFEKNDPDAEVVGHLVVLL